MGGKRRQLFISTVAIALGLSGGLALSPSVGAVNAPAQAPSAPNALAVIPANTALAVSWAAPTWTGGAPISSYVVNVVPGHESCTTVSLGCTVTGLTNGSQYAVRVQAINSVHAGGVARVKAIPSTSQNCSYVGVWANLQGCDLSSGSWRLIDLTGADLAGANLTGASFIGVNLTDVNLAGANLTNANLDYANLNGADLSGVIWSNTLCPDGWPSDVFGDTCVNDVNDEIAQGNMGAVVATANSIWASEGSFSGVTPTTLESSNPDLSVTSGFSTGVTAISVAVSKDGDGIIVAAYSQTHIDNCWYIYENQMPVASSGNNPWGPYPTGLLNQRTGASNGEIVVTTSTGVFYAEVKNAFHDTECSASDPQGFPATDYVYQNGGFPNL